MSIIKHESKFIRRKISHVWVKGHQLDTSQISSGTHKKDVSRNSHVDQLATWYREHSHKRQSIEKTDHTPEAKITISVNGVRLVSQMESCCASTSTDTIFDRMFSPNTSGQTASGIASMLKLTADSIDGSLHQHKSHKRNSCLTNGTQEKFDAATQKLAIPT
ncbi:hypothetical protein MHU86_17039 [Fragilaria crotonensis]|nr:hypothetical protein MHU86_17039 [Fragilaria crotonensis]